MTGFTLQMVPVTCPKCEGERMRPFLKKQLGAGASAQVLLLCEDCDGGRRLWVSKDAAFEYVNGKGAGHD